jgi:hypothetical protein
VAELTDRQEEIIKYVAGLLKEAAYRAGSKMLDFLILTNGGAAVACLGMIASASPRADDHAVKVFLLVFVIGLSLAGVLTVRAFLYTAQISFGFGETVEHIRAGSAHWDALGKIFKQPKRFYESSVLIGTLSLLMFAGGAIGASIWLLYPAH